MNTQPIESGFAQMGARFKVREIPSVWRRNRVTWFDPRDYSLDIQRDRKGEFFELRVPTHLSDTLGLVVLHSEPKQRHLLLLVRKTADKPQTDRFLCGHDEREWFVAAVPGRPSSVRQAMDALQPEAVRAALVREQVSLDKRYRRKNRAFRRQGEWFFVPESSLVVNDKLVLHNEPIRRGRGKPHMVEQLIRSGGEAVYVCRQRPNGLTEKEYRALLQESSEAAQWGWRVMTRNANVYARGKVRHTDHETVDLPFWHRVLMNTETQSRTMANVSFLD